MLLVTEYTNHSCYIPQSMLTDIRHQVCAEDILTELINLSMIKLACGVHLGYNLRVYSDGNWTDRKACNYLGLLFLFVQNFNEDLLASLEFWLFV